MIHQVSTVICHFTGIIFCLNICLNFTKIQMTRVYTLAELQRHKRQFITYTKMHPVEDTSKISSMFVQYLNNCLR